MSWFFATNASINNLFLRVGLGAVMLPHGLEKLGLLQKLGFSQKPGFTETMNDFALALQNHIHAMPSAVAKGFAVLAILAESFGAVALIFGFFTRLAAFGIFMTMAAAIWLVHGENGFFLPKGFEYNVLIMVVSFVLIFGGGGLASVDRALSKKSPTAA